MGKVQNLQKLLQFIDRRKKQVRRDLQYRVVVGYTASYALFVHENLEANHTNGQAKYLEAPARMMADELAMLVKVNLWRGRSLPESLLVAGLKLQAESQKLVPVDTGNLRASAFTKVERVGEMGE